MFATNGPGEAAAMWLLLTYPLWASVMVVVGCIYFRVRGIHSPRARIWRALVVGTAGAAVLLPVSWTLADSHPGELFFIPGAAAAVFAAAFLLNLACSWVASRSAKA